MLHELRDVVDEDLGEGLVSPWGRWVGNPIGQLGLPDQVVASDGLSGLLDVADELVCAGEVENVLLRLGLFELKRFVSGQALKDSIETKSIPS